MGDLTGIIAQIAIEPNDGIQEEKQFDVNRQNILTMEMCWQTTKLWRSPLFEYLGELGAKPPRQLLQRFEEDEHCRKL